MGRESILGRETIRNKTRWHCGCVQVSSVTRLCWTTGTLGKQPTLKLEKRRCPYLWREGWELHQRQYAPRSHWQYKSTTGYRAVLRKVPVVSLWEDNECS